MTLELVSIENVPGEGNNKEEKALKIEIQRLFVAFDINISNEIRAQTNEEIKSVISAIENIKAKTRKEKSSLHGEDLVDKATSQPTLASNPNSKNTIPPIGHIFISYSHQTTKRAMQLRDMLRDRGLPVWFDAEAIRGNSIEAMVLGLNDARLVIMCLSDGYRQSDFCKREAEYTVLKKKPFQPVILQEGFRMENDWLCFVVGLQNWIDLSGDHQFQTNKDQFVEHVRILFAGSTQIPAPTAPSNNTLAIVAPKPHAIGAEIQRVPSGRPKSGQLPPLQPKPEAQVAQWKNDQVLKWLDDENLASLKEKFVLNTYIM